MSRFTCPYLDGEVELTEEREQHIKERHPELVPKCQERIAQTLADPDEVRRSSRLANARLFSRRFDDIIEGKNVVVVVVSQTAPARRHGVITAYLVGKLGPGEVEWKRN